MRGSGGERYPHAVRATRLVAAATSAALTAALLAACSSGYRYVKSSSARTYFKVPSAWKLYNEDTIFRAQSKDVSPEQAAASKSSQWIVAFDGAPRPLLAHVLSERSSSPMGFARVRTLSPDERDTFSLASLRNEVNALDDMSATGDVEPLLSKEITRPGGLHGTRLIDNVRQNGVWVTFDQTALVDSGTHTLYLLLVGCEAHCYLAHRKVIDQVVDSWTVKAR